MASARVLLISVSVALCLAACSSPQPTGNPGTAGDGNQGGGTGGGSAGTTGSAGSSGAAGATGVAGQGTGVAGQGTGIAGSGAGGVGTAGNTSGGTTGQGGGTAGSGAAGTGVGGGATAGRGGAGGTATAGSSGGGTKPRFVSSGENAYWQTGTVMDMTSGTADVTINESSMQQVWDGFGGTFNEAGWDALSVLDATERDRAIQLLFGQDGTRFTYGRIPIGASDYGISRYTLNETSGDYQMTSFSLTRDKMRLIPYIKAALALNPNIKMWGSPWTPPPWMKDNNAYDRGNMKNDAQTLGAFALYLSKFVEEYGKEGIPIWAVHPQNEPGYLQDYPSCGWSGSQMANFIKTHLGPTFMQRNITAEIWMGTLSNGSVDPGIAQAVMADAGAKPFIKGFGMQWNTRSSAASFISMYGLPVMQTEHQCGNFPSGQANYNSTPAPNDHAYGIESWGLIRDWINTGVRSYLAWNMVLDTMGTNLDRVRQWNQNALLVVDRSARRLKVTAAYYVFRHFAQFVDPGARRIAISGNDAFAFKNPDGSVVAVMYNSGGSARTVTLQVRSGTLARFSIPARGWASLYQPAQ